MGSAPSHALAFTPYQSVLILEEGDELSWDLEWPQLVLCDRFLFGCKAAALLEPDVDLLSDEGLGVKGNHMACSSRYCYSLYLSLLVNDLQIKCCCLMWP